MNSASGDVRATDVHWGGGMKRFVSMLLRFLIPCASLLGLLGVAAFFTERNCYLDRIRLPPGVKFVAVGDSQPGCNIDPSAWPEVANQACTALSMEQALYKVRDLVRVNASNDFTVILDVSPLRLSKPLMPLVVADYESRYSILNYMNVVDSRRRLGDPIKLFRDRVAKNAFHIATGRKFHKKKRRADVSPRTAWGGFDACQKALYVEDPVKAESDTRDYASMIVDIYGDADAEERNLPILSEIVETVKAAGKRIVLTTTPWHKSLAAQVPVEVPTRFRKTMSKFAAAHDVVWLDFLNLDLEDGDFVNQNHLNEVGAVKFTRCLRRQLEGR